MTTLFRSRTTAIWAVLVAATLASWWLGGHHIDRRTAAVAVLIVVFFKCQLVGSYFMELRDAPRPLAGAFSAWCAMTCAATVAVYLAA